MNAYDDVKIYTKHVNGKCRIGLVAPYNFNFGVAIIELNQLQLFTFITELQKILKEMKK